MRVPVTGRIPNKPTRVCTRFWSNSCSTSRLRRPQLPENVGYTPSVAEVKALLRACRRGTFEGLRDHALVVRAFDVGLRANELRTLRLGDVDQQERVLRVTGKARPGQSPSVRFVPLSATGLRSLHSYLRVRDAYPWRRIVLRQGRSDGSMI